MLSLLTDDLEVQVWPQFRYGVVVLRPATTKKYDELVASMARVEVDYENDHLLMFINGVEIRKPKGVSQNDEAENWEEDYDV